MAGSVGRSFCDKMLSPNCGRLVSFGFELLVQRNISILEADVLNSPLVLVARTDAEAATMIDSNIEPWWENISRLKTCQLSGPSYFRN